MYSVGAEWNPKQRNYLVCSLKPILLSRCCCAENGQFTISERGGEGPQSPLVDMPPELISYRRDFIQLVA